MESCLGQLLPELKGSLPDGSATSGDLRLWKVDAEKFTEDCYRRHQDLIDYVNRRSGKAPADAEPEKSWWQKLFK
jgi:hypothetical protein